ncbi:MAG: hypothetical protein R3D32_03430 [Nitratireductor sp.]
MFIASMALESMAFNACVAHPCRIDPLLLAKALSSSAFSVSNAVRKMPALTTHDSVLNQWHIGKRLLDIGRRDVLAAGGDENILLFRPMIET